MSPSNSSSTYKSNSSPAPHHPIPSRNPAFPAPTHVPAPNFWQFLPRPFLILAPMEGVTDIIFRQVIAQAGKPDVFFTEFTNVSSYASDAGRHNALQRLQIAPTDSPIVAQIWGKNPLHFATLAKELQALGFQGLDLNMGCPDRHVNRSGGGAAMIRTPELALQCIDQARQATALPISVKTRLGYTSPDEFHHWLPLLLEQHLAALTIHLRTRKEMSKVPAHFELIPDIIALRNQISPHTKLIINGDIKNHAHAIQLHQQYPDLDGFMIGRGVFADPFCFRSLPQTPQNPHSPSAQNNAQNAPCPRTSSSIQNPPHLQFPSNNHQDALFALLHLHLDLFDAYTAQVTPRSFEPLKRFFKVYINNFPGASALREQLMHTTSTASARRILRQNRQN